MDPHNIDAINSIAYCIRFRAAASSSSNASANSSGM
jgi:hypothetical protein